MGPQIRTWAYYFLGNGNGSDEGIAPTFNGATFVGPMEAGNLCTLTFAFYAASGTPTIALKTWDPDLEDTVDETDQWNATSLNSGGNWRTITFSRIITAEIAADAGTVYLDVSGLTDAVGAIHAVEWLGASEAIRLADGASDGTSHPIAAAADPDPTNRAWTLFSSVTGQHATDTGTWSSTNHDEVSTTSNNTILGIGEVSSKWLTKHHAANEADAGTESFTSSVSVDGVLTTLAIITDPGTPSGADGLIFVEANITGAGPRGLYRVDPAVPNAYTVEKTDVLMGRTNKAGTAYLTYGQEGTTENLKLYRGEASGLTLLHTFTGDFIYSTQFSFDDTKIHVIVVDFGTGDNVIYELNVDGTGVAEYATLTIDDYGIIELSGHTSDGKVLWWGEDGGNVGSIDTVYATNSSEVTTAFVVGVADTSIQGAQLSPDGTKIAVNQRDDVPLKSYPITGGSTVGSPVTLTEAGRSEYLFWTRSEHLWSPDSTKLMVGSFALPDYEDPDIRILDAEDGTVFGSFSGEPLNNAVWAYPSGAWVFFEREPPGTFTTEEVDSYIAPTPNMVDPTILLDHPIVFDLDDNETISFGGVAWIESTGGGAETTIEIIDPEDGATVVGLTTVEAQVSGDLPDGGVQFSVDGVETGEPVTDNTDGLYTTLLNFNLFADGAHTIRASTDTESEEPGGGEIPWTTGRFMLYVNSPGSQDWSEGVATLAERHDIITLHHFSDTARLDQIKAARPECTVICYGDFLMAGVEGEDATILEVETCRTNGWLATTDGTTEIPNPWAAPGNDQRLIDPAKAGVTAAYVAAVQAQMASGAWDGMFLDDVNPYAEWWSAVPAINGHTATSWRAAMVSTLSAIKAGNSEHLFLPNVGSWNAYATEMDATATVLDGGLHEFAFAWLARSAQSATEVSNQLGSAATVIAADDYYIIQTPRVDGSDTESVLYNWALAKILDGDSQRIYASCAIRDNYGTQCPDIDEFTFDLGAVTSSLVNSTGLLWRSFENYTVYANTTASTKSLPGGGTLATLEGVFVPV